VTYQDILLQHAEEAGRRAGASIDAEPQPSTIIRLRAVRQWPVGVKSGGARS
jgi:hypothetical protein